MRHLKVSSKIGWLLVALVGVGIAAWAGQTDVFSLNERGNDIFRVKTGGDVATSAAIVSSGALTANGNLSATAATAGSFSVGWASGTDTNYLTYYDPTTGVVSRTVKNGAGRTLNSGDLVVWATTNNVTGGAAAYIRGVSITTATDANLPSIAGVMIETVTAGSKGKMAVVGPVYVNSAAPSETSGATEDRSVVTSTRAGFGGSIPTVSNAANAIGVWMVTSSTTLNGGFTGKNWAFLKGW